MLFYEANYCEYTENPFLDALPCQIMLSELIERLESKPQLPEDYKTLSTQQRLQLTERIADVYMPLDYAADIYNSIYFGIRSAYRGKTKISEVGTMNRNGYGIQHKKPYIVSSGIGQAECFSVLGEPGMGKTMTVNKILNFFPQVIHHTQYKDYQLDEYQVVYLRIECPSNNSPRGACLQILAALDDVLGTSLCDEEKRKGSNVDMLITKIAQVCTRLHVGRIVIDEIQNILLGHRVIPTSSDLMVKFLVELANKTGVCLAFIGTPAVAPYFDAEAHLSRRTRGPRIPFLSCEQAFDSILTTMWNYAPLLHQKPITGAQKQLVYKITNGSIAKIQKLIVLSSQQAIFFGEEQLSEDLLKKVSKQHNIIPTKAIMDASSPVTLSSLRPSKKSSQIEAVSLITEKNVPVSSDTDHQIDCLKIVGKKHGRPKAKRDPMDLLELYAECREKGWSLAHELEFRHIAERANI